jgi:hypothetical protein
MSATAPRDPDAGRAYPVTEAPEWGDRMPESLPGWGRRGNG